MRIGLIDCDKFFVKNDFPNLALMKISAWHKAKGDTVEWYLPFDDKYDIVYKSKVFSFTEDFTDVINADKVYSGGTGYNIGLYKGVEIYQPPRFDDSLIPEIEHIYPDYSLYNIQDTAYGFLTRGCPRGCSFCHVAAKEGKKSYKVADLSEFWNGQKNIVIMDPNILACRDREKLLQQLIDSNAYVDFNQGLDARMLNERICEMLCKIKIKNIHFAWDKYEDKNTILPKLELFAKYKYKGKNPDHNAIVYTLVNFDTTLEQDLERIYTLRELRYWAYVMIYNKEYCDPIYNKLQRWVNNRFIFAKCKRFEDYTE